MNQDNLVDVEIEFDDDVFKALALEAHRRDITFNQLMNIILREAIDNPPTVDEIKDL